MELGCERRRHSRIDMEMSHLREGLRKMLWEYEGKMYTIPDLMCPAYARVNYEAERQQMHNKQDPGQLLFPRTL